MSYCSLAKIIDLSFDFNHFNSSVKYSKVVTHGTPEASILLKGGFPTFDMFVGTRFTCLLYFVFPFMICMICDCVCKRERERCILAKRADHFKLPFRSVVVVVVAVVGVLSFLKWE